MADTGAPLNIELVEESQSSKEVTINAAFQAINDHAGVSASGYGLVAARPAATAVPAGTYYYATDTTPGIIYRSNGTTWDTLIAGNVANGFATLNGSSKVVQDPANAQTAAAASKIPISGSDGRIDRLWLPGARSTILANRSAGSAAGSDRRCSSIVSAVAGTTGSPAIDTLHAVPLVIAVGGLVDRISFRVTIGGDAGSKGRVGIYSTVSEDDEAPDGLVVDGGEYDTTLVQVNETTISVTLTPNRKYWLAYLCGVSAPTIRCHTAGPGNSIALGLTGIFGSPDTRISVAQAYGALPSVFPGGFVGFGGAPIPSISVRFG